MPKRELSDWLTKQEAARLVGVSERTLERLAAGGKIQKGKRKRSGRMPAVVYHPAEVERLRQSQQPEAEAFVVPEQEQTSDMSDTSPTTALAPVHLAPQAIMGMLAQALHKQSQASKLFLTLKEAVEYSGLPAAHLRRLIGSGELPAIRSGGYRIRRSDLEKL